MKIEEVLSILKTKNLKRVLLQFPEGLKPKIQAIVEKFEEKGIECLICGETTYGACDLRDEEAKRLGCDAIVHLGHKDFGVKSEIPVFYVEWFFDAKIEKSLFKLFSKFKKICLFSSLQYLKLLPQIKKILEEIGVKVVNPLEKSQIIGCKLSFIKNWEEKVDCFLIVSSGKFHGLGVALLSKKPTFVLDLDRMEIRDLESLKKKILKLKEWNKQALKEAKQIGFLISWKKGQLFADFSSFKKTIEKLGKKVYLIAMDELKPEKLEGMKFDLLINFACPRISIDDLERWKIPILNWEDLAKL